MIPFVSQKQAYPRHGSILCIENRIHQKWRAAWNHLAPTLRIIVDYHRCPCARAILGFSSIVCFLVENCPGETRNGTDHLIRFKLQLAITKMIVLVEEMVQSFRNLEGVHGVGALVPELPADWNGCSTKQMSKV